MSNPLDAELDLLLKEIRETGSSELREFARKSADFPVVFYRLSADGKAFQPTPIPGKAQDLSRGGVRIHCFEHLQAMEVVRIQLQNPRSARILEALAEVRWVKRIPGKYNIGLKFVRFVSASDPEPSG